MPPSSQAPCATPSPRGSGGPGPHPALATLCKAHVSPRRGGSQGEGTGRGPFRAPPPVGCGHDSRLALPRTPWRSLWHRGVSGDSRLSPGDPGASQTSVWWAVAMSPVLKAQLPQAAPGRSPRSCTPAPAGSTQARREPALWRVGKAPLCGHCPALVAACASSLAGHEPPEPPGEATSVSLVAL